MNDCLSAENPVRANTEPAAHFLPATNPRWLQVQTGNTDIQPPRKRVARTKSWAAGSGPEDGELEPGSGGSPAASVVSASALLGATAEWFGDGDVIHETWQRRMPSRVNLHRIRISGETEKKKGNNPKSLAHHIWDPLFISFHPNICSDFVFITSVCLFSSCSGRGSTSGQPEPAQTGSHNGKRVHTDQMVYVFTAGVHRQGTDRSG